MYVSTYIYGLKTSYITGNKIDQNILDLNKKVEESNKDILKLNCYIKMIEDKLSCFFDVDDDFIIKGN